jgi:hypothetical protein
MGSPDFVWINNNEIVSSWYLLRAVCVTPPGQVLAAMAALDEEENRMGGLDEGRRGREGRLAAGLSLFTR